MNKIRMAIVGYGNLGRGAESAIRQSEDLELVGVFTRRDPAGVHILTPGVPVRSMAELDRLEGEIDVLILCGGSMPVGSTWWTALTTTPKFPSTLPPWMPPPGRGGR